MVKGRCGNKSFCMGFTYAPQRHASWACAQAAWPIVQAGHIRKVEF
jgi:hypothetical protein